MISLNLDGKDGEPGLARIYCQFTALAAGAVPTALTRSNGFRQPSAAGASQVAVVKPGAAGLYDFFLWNAVPRLISWEVLVRQAAFANTGACSGNVTIDNVATPGVGNAKVRVTYYTAAGAPVDLAVGDIVVLVLNLQTTP